MQYLISFLEGIITFISPCLLPMLPIYISYFAGGGERTTKKTLTGVSGFVLGFTVVFVALGALAGILGSFLKQYSLWVNLISGLIVILFGLNYMGVLKFSIFKGIHRNMNMQNMNFGSAMVFGMVFSIGWTPCVGAFLGSALMLASQQGHVLEGMAMLLAYSLGLGVPFLVSAVFIDRMKTAFNWIKRHYDVINKISGGLLVLIGIAMATGYLGKFLNLMGSGASPVGSIKTAAGVFLAIIVFVVIAAFAGKAKAKGNDPMRMIRLLITVLALGILITGAYVLYQKLAPSVEQNNLAVAPGAAAPAEEEVQETTEPQTYPAPDFTLHDIDDKEYKLSDFRGKPVILNFWASWCGPCQMEMPDFQEMYGLYGEEIHFLMVNMTDGVRETVEKASGFIAEKGFTFPVYYDVYQEAAETYGVMSLPTTYFIDAEGNLVAQGRGMLNQEALQSGIDLLLPQK